MHADSHAFAAPRPAPDPLRERFVDDASAGRHLPGLLDAQARTDAAVAPAPQPMLRRRLLERVGRNARQVRAMVNVRRADIRPERPGAGVRVEPLYRAESKAGPGSTSTLRPGEPLSSELVVLEPGAAWRLPPAPDHDLVEHWLVLEGRVVVDGLALGAGDFHRIEGEVAGELVAGAGGARMLRRVARQDAAAWPAPRMTVRGGERADWTDFGPGIQRRVLHAEAGGAATMLYRTLPGAAVPHHGHRHDEECFMVAGELFLDDYLLRPGEYQLAPAGTEHGSVFTDTGVVLYVHGDLELDLRVA